MVNSKELAIGYIFIFLGLYLLSISAGTVYYKFTEKTTEIPQYLNATIDATESLNYSSFALLSVSLIVLAVAIIIGGLVRSFGAF